MLIDEQGKVLQAFRSELETTGAALHCGVKRSNPEVSTRAMQEAWFPPGWQHAGTDIEPGDDVDFMHDLQIWRPFSVPYDAIVCCSVLEHIEKPWLVPDSLRSACKKGTSLYVQTHQTFPVHGYPQDFYRFTDKALTSLFSQYAGWKPIICEYEFPCHITAEVKGSPWIGRSPSYLNVSLFARAV